MNALRSALGGAIFGGFIGVPVWAHTGTLLGLVVCVVVFGLIGLVISMSGSRVLERLGKVLSDFFVNMWGP